MLRKRLHVKIIAIVIMVFCVLNLIFNITAFAEEATYLDLYDTGSAIIYVVSAITIPIILAMPIISMIRVLKKPYKYWIQFSVNSIAISLFAFTFLRGFLTLLQISLYSSLDDFYYKFVVIGSIAYSVWLIVFSVIFLVLGIIASSLMMKRKKACDVLYIIIIGLSFILYLLMFSTMGGYEPSATMVATIILMLVELGFAIVNAIERESIEEFNEFLDSIEHRYKRLYNSLSRYFDARQASANNVTKKTTKDTDANDNQQDDNAYQEEKIWEERGMIFSNKE